MTELGRHRPSSIIKSPSWKYDVQIGAELGQKMANLEPEMAGIVQLGLQKAKLVPKMATIDALLAACGL